MTVGRGQVTLLDVNVLIAWVVEDHEHHDVVVRWLAASDGTVALCPLTGLMGSSLQGHRQVTDDYLALLTASHQGRLATLDRALAGRHPDSTALIAVPA